MPHRVLSANEAAQYLQLSRADLDRLVEDGRVPCENRGGRLIFRRPELDEWGSLRILEQATGRRSGSRRAVPARKPLAATIAELIEPAHIEPELLAKTKPSVLREMVRVAARTGWVNDSDELVESIERREALGSTAVPGGMALLHPRVQEPYRFEQSFFVLGRTVQPIFFGAPDREGTDLFFLLCLEDGRRHLETLAHLCLMVEETDLLAQLRGGVDAAEMHGALLAAEEEVLRTRRG